MNTHSETGMLFCPTLLRDNSCHIFVGLYPIQKYFSVNILNVVLGIIIVQQNMDNSTGYRGIGICTEYLNTWSTHFAYLWYAIFDLFVASTSIFSFIWCRSHLCHSCLFLLSFALFVQQFAVCAYLSKYFIYNHYCCNHYMDVNVILVSNIWTWANKC